MSVSYSKSAYLDCFEYFDRALKSSIGIRVACRNRGSANNLRVRMHYARAISRREFLEIYQPDDPRHGQSPYDVFMVRIEQDDEKWWLYIEPRTAGGEIEELVANGA
jgi:hypothetical protein